MSGLYLLGLIAIWLFVGWLIYRFWRSATVIKDFNKIVHYALGGVLFLVWFASGFWPFAGKKIYYDTQVMEMCEKDGGVTVYETVELPVEMFNRWDQPNFYHPTKGENALGPEYAFKQNIHYYRHKPTVMRFNSEVVRHSDDKLLGRSIVYKRSGGDLSGFWHPSSYICPERAGEVDLFMKIFIRRNKE
ncbi:MAG: hypothetical protein KZQ94_01235 [Candidatus Thiodiazotropha sp. (ex Troendleina suluensis)]|nr:hypothetical protein [Candidatus Thiodiazotropha sp. (ex Troendleina suluensis)]